MSAKLKNMPIPSDAEYANLVDLLALHTEATTRMGELENAVQEAYLAIIDENRKLYASLQSMISDSEAAIKLSALQHPEWFQAVKTLKTPYGTVGFRSATKLEVANEEMTIALIERLPDAELYLRTRKFLNLEALEMLEDFALKGLKIARVTSDKCTVTPAKIDLGKAVKKAAEKEEVAL